MAIYTKKKLYFRKTNTYSYNLMTATDVTTSGYSQKLGVCIDDEELGIIQRYVPAASGSASNQINFRKGGATYHCVNVVPRLTVSYSCSTSAVVTSGSTIVTYTMKLTGASINIPINTSLDIFFSNNGGNSYTKAFNFPAGATKVSGFNTSLSVTGSPNFRIQVKSSVSFQSVSGSVKWHETGGNATIHINAAVTLSKALGAGKITYRGEYNSTLPPWHSYGTSTVLSAGKASGSATRDFAGATLGAIEYQTILYYNPETAGVGTKKLCERGWAAPPIGTVDLTFSDSFTFNMVGGVPQVIATFTPTFGAASSEIDIPETWW